MGGDELPELQRHGIWSIVLFRRVLILIHSARGRCRFLIEDPDVLCLGGHLLGRAAASRMENVSWRKYRACWDNGPLLPCDGTRLFVQLLLLLADVTLRRPAHFHDPPRAQFVLPFLDRRLGEHGPKCTLSSAFGHNFRWCQVGSWVCPALLGEVRAVKVF